MSGIYLSFPFCSQKCTFCNFASGVFPRELEMEYGDALLKEVQAHSWCWNADTVYLGGGTPSQMEPRLLHQLLDSLPGRPWKEATIEAAPGTLTREKVCSWRKAGINRVSLGVQSFVRGELAQTGRKHDASNVAADCALLRGAGFDNINIDLIAGLPGQTMESWDESLDWIERLDPPHVSVYLLEVDEDSRLGLEILNNGTRYGAGKAPSGDLSADLYERAVDRLALLGLRRYEISNFARPGMESRHNLKYWRLEPYVGFGADAHSFDGGTRTSNVETAQEYVLRHQQSLSPVSERIEARHEEEHLYVGLRLSVGIEPCAEEWERFAQPIGRFVQEGLLERDGATLRLTRHGVLLSNEVFQEFISL
ncbi:MAG: radical SAM family heme chaperone HemW [Bryobacteraceae bacterium]